MRYTDTRITAFENARVLPAWSARVHEVLRRAASHFLVLRCLGVATRGCSAHVSDLEALLAIGWWLSDGRAKP